MVDWVKRWLNPLTLARKVIVLFQFSEALDCCIWPNSFQTGGSDNEDRTGARLDFKEGIQSQRVFA